MTYSTCATNNRYLGWVRCMVKYTPITILLVDDPLSSSVCPMMTHPLPVAGNLPIKTLVARQLPTHMKYMCSGFRSIILCKTVRIFYLIEIGESNGFDVVINMLSLHDSKFVVENTSYTI